MYLVPEHKLAQISFVLGDKAYPIVYITSLDGQELVFAFRLGLQKEGIYKGMWLTEAVWPLDDATNKGLAI